MSEILLRLKLFFHTCQEENAIILVLVLKINCLTSVKNGMGDF